MYEGMSKGEQQAARRIIRRALHQGWTVSVADGEGGWELRRSSDFDAIMDSIGNMDMDELIFREADGTNIGWMMLVWGNAPDGSELAADYTATSPMSFLVGDAR